MADQDVEEDIFADLYDDNDVPAPAKPEPAEPEIAPLPEPEPAPVQNDSYPPPSNSEQLNEISDVLDVGEGDGQGEGEAMHGIQGNDGSDDYDRPIGIKEDG